MSRLLTPIEDPLELAKARALVAPLVEPPEDFNLEWLRKRSWTAVPMVAAGLDFDEAIRLAEAAHDFGCRECIAVVADPKIKHPVCSAYRVPLTGDAFLEVGREYDGGVPYLLLPPDAQFAILVGWEQNIYAGPRGFVERVIGRSVDVARREFWRDRSEPSGPGRQACEELARRYESFNGEG